MTQKVLQLEWGPNTRLQPQFHMHMECFILIKKKKMFQHNLKKIMKKNDIKNNNKTSKIQRNKKKDVKLGNTIKKKMKNIE